jgi:multidrug efflux system membrane fusion protein
VSRQRIDDRQSVLLGRRRLQRRRLRPPLGPTGLAGRRRGAERAAQAGEVVQPGQVVVRVADLTSPLVLRLPLAARDAARVGSATAPS